ncbi:MAG: molybdenum cofactor guanylyltransferase [Acidimicrobiia bacterium]|nr:molybdenum cofactor guanylyltransferase [Acidimicrobiia bacterium]
MIPLYILAGGKSIRFGSDKARAELAGQPLIARVAQALTSVVSSTTVVADVDDKYLDLGLRTISDDEPGLGPMGGLVTALGDVDDEELLLVSCDMAFVDPGWVALLMAVPGHAVAFRDAGGWQPLFAVYRRSVASQVHDLIAAGELSMQVLLDNLAKAVPVPAKWAGSINTPQELDGLRY